MLKIYLVDDEPLILEELLAIIPWEKLGYEVCGYSTDPIEAIEDIKNKQPHILISDIDMPCMNGLKMIEAVSQENPSLGVILLTAYDIFDYALQAINLQALAYLLKPVNEKECCKQLKKFRLKKANELFCDFFKSALLEESSKEIIREIEKQATLLGFIQKGKRYVFASADKGDNVEHIIAEYVKDDLRLLLLEVKDYDEDLIPDLHSQIFEGCDVFYKYIKEVISLLNSLSEEDNSHKDVENAIGQILKDIEEDYSKKVSLGYYAEKYHYNLTYLSQQFKLYVGMTYIDYIVKFRLAKAKEFMKDRKLSINEISLKVGYEDYSHFSKIFKKYEGCSPADYRKNYY